MRGLRPSIHAAPAPPREYDPYDGVLIVDKPSGPTSHDIVDTVRRQFNFRKTGHGGTLDPMATGVLVLLLGRATKLSNTFISSDKTYEGTIRLGSATSSYDAEGEITASGDPTGITGEQLSAAMKARIGDMMQTPPMVSAVKVNGVPLYKSARKGHEIERKARLIHIYSFELLSYTPPDGTFRLACTKGTYVRSLCHEIGEELGCCAHLAGLRRTASGSFTIDQALPLEQISAMSREELLPHIVPLRSFAGELRR